MRYLAKLHPAVVALVALLPALLFAGPSASEFAKWEKEMAAFDKADAASPPPKGAVLFIGSSTVRLWTSMARDFPQYRVINRGFGGSQIADATHFAPRIVFPYRPKAVYLRAGGNDLWAGKPVERVFADYKDFVATVRAALPDADIVFVSQSPSIARWKQADATKALNALVSDYVKGRQHLRYIETYDIVLAPDGTPRPELFVADQLHFNAEGYKLLAARVRPDLEAFYSTNATSSRAEGQ